ncbi:MAG: YlbF family regulator [bacterium]|nr:YlbF family regulator [bacterium]
MDIIETARQLGVAIQQDESFKRYIAAMQANDNSDQLQKLIGEFNLIRMQLDSELAKEEKDDSKVTEINNNLRSLYTQIMQHELMVEYNAAKTAVDEIMNKVQTLLSKTLSGEDPMTCELNGCSGSCASCGGCH